MTSIEEVTTKASTLSVTDAVTRLTELINAKGMKVFAVIDQRDEARRVGLDLRETVLVLFGSPVAGTPIMDAYPLAAVDLPLKVLVWAGEDGTRVSYTNPIALAVRYRIEQDLARKLAGIDQLTDAIL